MVDTFDFYCPTKIEFGENTVEKIKPYIEKLGMKNPIIVTDKILMQIPRIIKAIEEIGNGIIFDEVLPNPTNNLVMQLKSFVEKNQADGFVVFGGGSAIDSAKAAAVVAYTGNNVKSYYDFAEGKLEIEKALPIIAVPTTAGTGSEVSKYSVISDEDSKIKECLTSDLIVPKVAIVDPKLTVGMPAKVTISTGLDALSHALESLVSNIENPLTNIMAREAIGLILDNLNIVREDGENIQARSNMSFAALIAGIAMSHCCGTIGHAMGCQLTSQYQVPHGIACAVIQKDALDYVGEKVVNIKNLVDVLDKEDIPVDMAVTHLKKKLDDLFQKIEMQMDVKDYHINEKDIAIMTKDAMEHGCMGLNPIKMQENEIQKLYEKIAN